MPPDSQQPVEADAGELDCEALPAPLNPIPSARLQVPKPTRPTTPSLSPLLIPVLDPRAILKLPPQDKGWPAWRVLFAATIQISVVSGFYLAFGVFHEYYMKTALENASESAWIGVLSSGIPFLGAPGVVWLCIHRSMARIHYVWVGFLICIASLLGAAFSRTISTLIVTQGLLFGLGILLMDNPLMIIVNTWFVKRRGIAYGILFAVCDLFGFGWSFFAEHLLQHLGLRKTMLVFAAVVFALSGPCIFLLRERGAKSIFSPGAETPTPHTPMIGSLTPMKYQKYAIITRFSIRRYYQCSMFYVLALSNLAQALAYYLPFIYLPSFTTALGYSSAQGALVLALANLAQIVGEVGFGMLSDHVNVHVLVVVSSTGAAVSTFLLWGFAKSFGMLIAYAISFGALGAGYIALWARMGTLFGEKDAPMVYSVMCAGRGLGSIASGPISSALLGREVIKSAYGVARFRRLVIFAGLSLAVSACLGTIGVVATAKTMLGGRTFRLRKPAVKDSCAIVRISQSHHSDGGQEKKPGGIQIKFDLKTSTK